MTTMNGQPIAPRELRDSLAKHLSDAGWITARELPLGSAWAGGTVPRADIYALKKTYKVRAVVYEVKQSRSDFSGDVLRGKYEAYYAHCQQLYFATPKGLVTKSDVPEGCGLITYSADTGWHVVATARVRAVEIPTSTMLSLLFRGYEEFVGGRQVRQRIMVSDNVTLADQATLIGHGIARRLREVAPDQEKVDEAQQAIDEVLGSPSRDIEDAAWRLRLFIKQRLPGMENWEKAVELVRLAHEFVTQPNGSFGTTAEDRLTALAAPSRGK